MKTGKIIIPVVLLLVWIPFVFQTDLYPLFRFGMFAEPVRREIQTEYFSLRIISNAHKTYILSPEETKLGSLAYLMRNYYYRHEADTLLRRIHSITPHADTISEWQLLRMVSEVDHRKVDTTVVASFKPSSHE
ncbi:hypothetical protein QNI19_19285 [Cytophagaceae bacterium DM2B3-1]|uniref:Uncharacterized protein n=1 Tax=Xanthocytophaga flava TaxID=3048013 RepID=A0ABT7CMX6_9BACT|nr:hypothetical protein [Xanthocytophaga flavus]MDJ1495091.1 hypothetical protein [Xanthocytophaga flavus]